MTAKPPPSLNCPAARYGPGRGFVSSVRHGYLLPIGNSTNRRIDEVTGEKWISLKDTGNMIKDIKGKIIQNVILGNMKYWYWGKGWKSGFPLIKFLNMNIVQSLRKYVLFFWGYGSSLRLFSWENDGRNDGWNGVFQIFSVMWSNIGKK